LKVVAEIFVAEVHLSLEEASQAFFDDEAKLWVEVLRLSIHA
jgi:hypothetical protein